MRLAQPLFETGTAETKAPLDNVKLPVLVIESITL
jgi:hypothetical protein